MSILIPCPRCSGTGTVAHEDGQVLGDEPDGLSDYAGKIEAFFDEAARVGLGVEAMRAYVAEGLRILNEASTKRALR